MIVGICGGSASGKTTFSGGLVQALEGVETVVLNQDRYFRDWERLPAEQREAQRTSNHPRAVLWDVLIALVAALQSGRSIQIPVEGTRAQRQGMPAETVGPGELVIVEGRGDSR